MILLSFLFVGFFCGMGGLVGYGVYYQDLIMILFFMMVMIQGVLGYYYFVVDYGQLDLW